MTVAANQYANKVFSEHPIAMWPMDEQAYYLSMIDDNDRLLTNWTNPEVVERVNLIPNPSFEVTNTWGVFSGATAARITSDAASGRACLEVTKPAGTHYGVYTSPQGLKSGVQYTASVYVKVPAGQQTSLIKLWVDWSNGSSAIGSMISAETTVTSAMGWTRISVTGVSTAGTTMANFHVLSDVAGTAGQKWLVDGAMLEESATLNEYFDGSTGADWSGTRHLSTSIKYREDRVNLCRNPSIETSTTNWVGIAGATLSRVTNDGYLGGSCLQVVTTSTPGDGANTLTYQFPIDTEYIYVSAWVKIDTGNPSAYMDLYGAFNVGGVTEYSGAPDSEGTTTAGAGWKQLFGYVKVPAGAREMTLGVRSLESSPRTYKVDKVMIEALQGSDFGPRDYFDGDNGGSWLGAANESASIITFKNRTNLILNPSFEAGVGGVAGANTTLSQSASFARYGTKSLLATVNGTGSTQYVDIYPQGFSASGVTEGKTYTFSAWVYIPASNTANTNFHVAVYPYDGTSYLANVDGAVSTLTRGSWTRLSVSHTVPAGTVSLLCRVISDTLMAVGQVWYMDGLLLEESPALLPFFDGNTTNASWSGTVEASTSTMPMWYANNSPSPPDDPSPFDDNVYSSFTKSEATAGTVEIQSPDLFNSTNVDINNDQFTINAFLYQNPTYINWFKIGYRYTDAGGVAKEIVSDEIPAPSASSWVNLNQTYTIPASWSGSIKAFIQVNFKDSTAGDAASRTVILHGFSVGQGSATTCYESLGSTPISIPTEFGYTGMTGISADQYGVLADNGYYLVRSNQLLANNDGMPIIYGTDHSTAIHASGVGLPSFVFPGKGMLHETGRNKAYTLEMWMKLDPQTTRAQRILGPIDSLDGLYVKEGFLTLAIGGEIGSHFVSDWYRPMLVHIELKDNSATVILNGEQVISIPFDRKTVDLPDGNDWWGVYSYSTISYFNIDCISIFPYNVSATVAKRHFVYGQGTPNIQSIDNAYRGTPTTIEFATSEYDASVIYPDIARWDAGYFNNLTATRDYLSVPNYTLPIINIGGRDLKEWYGDNLAVNDLEYPDGQHPKFMSFRPNVSSAESLLASAPLWIDAAKVTGTQKVNNLGYGGPQLDARAGATASGGLEVVPGSHVRTPNVNFNWIYADDSTAFDIVGDIDIRVKVAVDRYDATYFLASRRQANLGWWLYVTSTSLLRFGWSADGSTQVADVPSSATLISAGYPAGYDVWVRVTLDVNNGASGRDVKFYTSDDGVTWNQLGTTQTSAGVTSLFNSSDRISFMSTGNGDGWPTPGKFYRGIVKNGIDGTTVLDVDASVTTDPSQRAFTAITGQAITIGDSGTDSQDPKYLDWNGENYVYLPGLNMANRMDIPDSAALDIVGDIDISLEIAPDDWTPASNLGIISKMNGDNAWRLFLLSDGRLQFDWFTSANVNTAAASTVSLSSLANGTRKWIRVTLDVDNGSSGYTVTFYTSDNGSAWTQLGATVTNAGVQNIKSTADNVFIGVASGSTLPMKVYKVIIKNGINGTVVANVDTSVISSSSATSFLAISGQTITISRMTSGKKTVAVTEPCFLFGNSAYLEVADNPLLDFGAGDSLTVIAVARQWTTPLGFGHFVSKLDDASPYNGYALRNDNTSFEPRFDLGDTAGNRIIQTDIAPYSVGALTVMTGVVDRAAGLTYAYRDMVKSPNISTATVSDMSTATPLRIGAGYIPAGPVYYNDMELIAVAVFRKALTEEEIQRIVDYYNNRSFVAGSPVDIPYWDYAGINYQEQSYFNFPTLNALNEAVAAVYGVFQADSNIASDRTLMSFVNITNGDTFDITINGTSVTYSINGVALRSPDTITIGTEFAVGLNFNEAGTYFFDDGVSKFFSSPASIQLYIGGNGINTFEGKIYSVGLANAENFRKIQDNFDASGLATPNTYALLLDHFASYTLLPEYEYGELYLDVSVSSQWEEYYPLSYFASYVEDGSGNPVYDIDMLQVNIGYPTVATSDVWTYAELKAEFTTPNDYADLRDSIYLDYFGLKKKNATGSTVTTANSSLQSYLTFQSIADGANRPLADFPYSAGLEENAVIYSDMVNTFNLPEKVYDTKFLFKDNVVVFPPKTNNFEDYALVVHLEINQRSILKNPLKIKSMEISANNFNYISDSDDPAQRNYIGTKFGKKVYPYTELMTLVDHKVENPLAIHKTSTPYLYTTRKSGIRLVNESLVSGSPSESRVFIPINESGSLRYNVAAIQFMVKPEFVEDDKTIKFIEIKHKNGRLLYGLSKIGGSGTLSSYGRTSDGLLLDGGTPTPPTFDYIFDGGTPTSVYPPTPYLNITTDTNDIVPVVDTGWSPVYGSDYYQNGRYVPSPVLENNEWSVVGIVFPEPLDFSEFADGGITIFGGAVFNNISYYLEEGLGVRTDLTTRTWQGVYDVDGTVPSGTTWAYWAGDTWQYVYLLGQASSYISSPADIYEAYVGTNSEIVDDGYGLTFDHRQAQLISGATWSIYTSKPA